MKVLDASGIINAREKVLSGEFLTTPQIAKELKDTQSKIKFEVAKEAGELKLKEPSDRALETVCEQLRQKGVLSLLSDSDISVIALGFEEKVPIVTDDYDIQNACKILEMPYEKVILKGITNAYSWVTQCNACKKKYNCDISECEVCGSTDFKKTRVLLD